MCKQHNVEIDICAIHFFWAAQKRMFREGGTMEFAYTKLSIWGQISVNEVILMMLIHSLYNDGRRDVSFGKKYCES